MGPINVVVQDANNLVLEVTPTPNNTVILDRGIAGPTGVPGINWIGPWNSATTYAIRDAVSYNGSSYYAIAVNTNQAPPNASFWNLLAQKGTDGTGTGDVVGPASSTDNAIARFDGVTGKLIQNSLVTIADDGTTVIGVSSASAALRVTQAGSGNALLVEDSANPDASPFVIDSVGRVIQGDITALLTADDYNGNVRTGWGYQGNVINPAGALFTTWNVTAASGAGISLSRSRSSTVGVQGIVASGDSLGGIGFNGDDGANFIVAASISAEVDGTPGTNDMPGRVIVSTTPDGSSTPVERFRIVSTGAFGLSGANYGTSGQVLTSAGSGATPTWTTPTAQVYPAAGMAVSTGTTWGTSKATPTGDVVGTTDTQPLTNKRITPRSTEITSSATITPTGDTTDQYEITALATAATIAAPSGTPTDGQKLVLRFKDNGTARALTWTTTSGAYRAVGVTLPTTTLTNRVLYVGCVWNAQDNFWDVIATAQQA